MEPGIFILPTGQRRTLVEVQREFCRFGSVGTLPMSRFLVRNMAYTALFPRSTYWHLVYDPHSTSLAAHDVLAELAETAAPERVALEYLQGSWLTEVRRFTPDLTACLPYVNAIALRVTNREGAYSTISSALPWRNAAILDFSRDCQPELG